MLKIAIHSVPRSGSTWLGNIFNSHPNVVFRLQPLFSYAFKDYLNENSTVLEIDDFFKELEISDDAFINQKEGIEKGIIPEFSKRLKTSHCCYKEVRYHHILENMLNQCDDIKLILLIRNPLAVIYSWYNAPKEFKLEKGWVFEEEWLDAPKKNLNKPEEFNGYSKWKEATLLFHNLKNEFPNNVHLIVYNNLISNTVDEIKRVFSFCDLSLEAETLDFISSSSSLNQSNAYSVYKKKQNDLDWKELPNHIISYINRDLKNTTLERYLND